MKITEDMIPAIEAALLSMGIDLDSTSLKRKLRAISKHTAALADELDAIDEEARR